MSKEKAKKIARENGMDRVLDIYKDRDYCEVIGKMGGDTVTYRIYNNGMICER